MDVGIIMPRVFMQESNANLQQLVGGGLGYPDASNTFIKGALLYLDASGNLAATPTDPNGTTQFASFLAMRDSDTATVPNPPTIMNPGRHWPLYLKDVLLAMNITDSSGNVGQAASAPTLAHANVVKGKNVGLFVPTTGTYDKRPMVDVTDTTNLVFTIVDIPDRIFGFTQSPLASTYNGIVIVKIRSAMIQNVG